MIDDLVAAVIHDAKNALLGLDTQLGEIARRPAGADFSQARADVARIAARLSELLTLYRAESGQLRLAIDDHDLVDFFDDLATEIGPLPAHVRVEFDREGATRIGAWAFDAYLVKLVLLDALRNALRHARSVVRVGASLPPTGAGMALTVCDDGPGFADALLAGTTTAAEPAICDAGGTGLGLRFARSIAERHATPDGHHGRLHLANAPTGGARLNLWLP